MRVIDFNLVKERINELMEQKSISNGVALDFLLVKLCLIWI